MSYKGFALVAALAGFALSSTTNSAPLQRLANRAAPSGETITGQSVIDGAPNDVPERVPIKPVSMPFALQDNLVRIEASINGRPQSAVLDSGSGAVVLDRATTARLGLLEGQTALDAGGAGEEARSILPVSMEDFSAGPLRFRGLQGYSGDLSSLSSSAGFPIDVLVGGPAFKNGVVSVNYPHRTVTFSPSGSAPKCATPIPITFVADTPVVEVELRPTSGSKPVRLRLMVDLGTRHAAAMIGGAFLRSEAGRALIRSGVDRQVGTGIGGAVRGSVAHVAELSIAGSSFGDMDVSLTSSVGPVEKGMIDGTLGVPLWQRGIITFDYPARTLCINLPPS